MPELESSEVLTLAEASAYLRVSEASLEKLASRHEVPAQNIDGEWRFLKRALNGWLAYGRSRELHFPLFFEMFDSPALYRLLKLLESPGEKPTAPKRGTKAAVLKHAGSVGAGENAEEWLEELRAIRDAAG